ncbi:hypothetical protein PTKIN_Ptkin10aG0111800 [Pterospermum kingtungense]
MYWCSSWGISMCIPKDSSLFFLAWQDSLPAALGQPGLAGIGGILRDCEAKMKLRFSKSVGVADSRLAEVLAVKEAFILFSSSQWSSPDAC